ncbi:hypothetical protein D3C76_1698550 [compost metagenome]
MYFDIDHCSTRRQCLHVLDKLTLFNLVEATDRCRPIVAVAAVGICLKRLFKLALFGIRFGSPLVTVITKHFFYVVNQRLDRWSAFHLFIGLLRGFEQ